MNILDLFRRPKTIEPAPEFPCESCGKNYTQQEIINMTRSGMRHAVASYCIKGGVMTEAIIRACVACVAMQEYLSEKNKLKATIREVLCEIRDADEQAEEIASLREAVGTVVYDRVELAEGVWMSYPRWIENDKLRDKGESD